MDQVVQVIGSLLVLVAFAGSQRGQLSQSSRTYLVLNLGGSSVLAVLAAGGQQWGFLLLEAVWAVVSASSLVRVLRG
jgi:hypothetical protein